MAHALLLSLTFALYILATFVLVDVAVTTYKHYSKGNEFHPEPFPIPYAFIVAVVEVCYDKPVAFHRARMAAMRDMEDRRADAIEAAMLRHPSNYDARADAMLRHPSNFAARQASMFAHPSSRSTSRDWDTKAPLSLA